MQKVLTAEQMRTVDRLTTERYGIPSILLMENAAHAVARVITEKLGGSVKGKSVLVLCGTGNNGGDGAALARILWQNGADVSLVLLGLVDDTKGDARVNFEAVRLLSTRDLQVTPLLTLYEIPEPIPEAVSELSCHDVFVDALFGTGLTRPMSEEVKKFVSKLRFSGKWLLRIAIDLPSGLTADSGEIIGPAFHSAVTVTFTAPKYGNVLPPSSNYNGELIVANIGTPPENFDLDGYVDDFTNELLLTDSSDIADWLTASQFSSDSYKNKRGHTLVIAGSENYSGAAVLAGNASMRTGVGLVTVVTPRSSKALVASRLLPEVMVRGVVETENGTISEAAYVEVGDLLEKSDSIVIGCGVSQDESTKKFVVKVVENRRQPVIVDADALNLLSPFSANWPYADAGGSDIILTPHEGEFMRLLGTDDKDAIKDRVAAVRDFAVKYKVILVLKGERVLMGAPDGRVVVNPTGNSGLGKAGNGDTLAGILAGFVAQAVRFNIDIFETVVAAVYVAGMAGDIAEKKYGKRVMTASDVRECLTETFVELAGN
ncbi:MAG: NAD(P)H-hydrate dehydratase [Chloracidobacterium sp.]|nr:NAD(P)H-hydrate dehydratase [Chloracidobacterium sp.]